MRGFLLLVFIFLSIADVFGQQKFFIELGGSAQAHLNYFNARNEARKDGQHNRLGLGPGVMGSLGFAMGAKDELLIKNKVYNYRSSYLIHSPGYVNGSIVSLESYDVWEAAVLYRRKLSIEDGVASFIEFGPTLLQVDWIDNAYLYHLGNKIELRSATSLGAQASMGFETYLSTNCSLIISSTYMRGFNLLVRYNDRFRNNPGLSILTRGSYLSLNLALKFSYSRKPREPRPPVRSPRYIFDDYP